MNSLQFDDLLKSITTRNWNVGQTYHKKHLNYTILVKYCVKAIPRNSNRFLMVIERGLSQKDSAVAGSYSSFFIIFIQNGIKRIRITYWWNKRFMQVQCGPLFLDFRGNWHPVTWKRAALRMSPDSREWLFRW